MKKNSRRSSKKEKSSKSTSQRSNGELQKIFHPGRKEHAEKYVSNVEGDKAKEYATAQLKWIWSGGKAPSRPKKLSAARVREIDAALLAIFATL